MAIQGEQILHGIELDNSYVHITRVGCNKVYQEIGNTWAKFLSIDYDFGIFKNEEEYVKSPNNPLKRAYRIRFQQQIVEGVTSDVWILAYSNLKTQNIFRDFDDV